MKSLEYYRNLYLTRMNTLKGYHSSMNNYSIIAATNELRYFLFDSPCITDMFLKYTETPIDFIVNNQSFPEEDGGTPIYLWKDITPTDEERIRILKRQEFLKEICIYYLGKSFTVIDIIKYYGFVRGGIHLNPKKKKEYKDLEEAFNLLIINTQISTLDHSMAGITGVALDGIENYYNNVLKDL